MPYTAPTVADFKARFPGLADIGDPVIQTALDEAAVRVDETWREEDFAPGRLFLAAHNLTLEGHGKAAEVAGFRAQGITAFKSGAMSAEFKGSDRTGGSLLETTAFGLRYLGLLELNGGGPFVARGSTGAPSHLAHDWPAGWGWR